MRKSIIVSAIGLLVLASLSMAGEMAAKKKMPAKESTFEGTMVCVFCDLKQTEGARSNCKEFGHEMALKTDDGKYINLIANEYANDLLHSKDYIGKKVKLSGTYYANANELDVQSVESDGHTLKWCDTHHKMDGCWQMK